MHFFYTPILHFIAFHNDNSYMILSENVDRKIIPIAGGKGGVGKSVIAVNLALSFAMHGKKTVLVDLDLGGSNIHTLLGEKNIRPGVGNVISGLKSSLSALACSTRWDNFYYIPGDVLVCGIGELTLQVKNRIIESLIEIEADYIILDLGGGSNYTILDFFLICNSGIIVTTPQTISVLNAYLFLRNYSFRFLQRAFVNNKQVSGLLRRRMKERYQDDRMTMEEIIREISSKVPSVSKKAEAFLGVLQPKLILNKVRSTEDIGIGETLRDLCKNTLSINLECLGTVFESDIVNKSVDTFKPFVAELPQDIVSKTVQRIALKIMQSSNFPKMPLDYDYYSDSFELAQIETENDIAFMQEIQEPNQSQKPMDLNQMLELIRTRQSSMYR
ncbi:MAG: hypothetical protein B0D92_07725 [Spirochaeta sp. LUC14_002_19_P3]|nr:MAG: hypothetical protein B0D92_07725 [Spirochaeta sp. LUC14_002_19_P3]